MYIDPHQTGFVGKRNSHLQLIKYWPSRAPRRGLRQGKHFWLHRTTASAQCLRLLRALFSLSEHYQTLSDYRALSDTSRSHQTSSKSDDPRLRYSDKTIFKMAAVGHLEFSKLAILTTWPVSEIRTTKFSINRTINR